MLIRSPIYFYNFTVNVICTVWSDFFKLNKSVGCTVHIIYNVLISVTVGVIAVNNKSTCKYTVPLCIKSDVFHKKNAFSCGICTFFIEIPAQEIVFFHNRLISVKFGNIILTCYCLCIVAVYFTALSIKSHVVLFNCDNSIKSTCL